MTEQHPITPPPELFKQWNKAALSPPDPFGYNEYIAIQAARWGADQELEACCKWLHENNWNVVHKHLRAGRRPKPLSLAEESLALIDKIQSNKKMWLFDELDVVRRALKRLQELEQN